MGFTWLAEHFCKNMECWYKKMILTDGDGRDIIKIQNRTSVRICMGGLL